MASKTKVTWTRQTDGSVHLRVASFDVFCEAVMSEDDAHNDEDWTRWAKYIVPEVLLASTPEERIDLDLEAGRVLQWCIKNPKQNGLTWFDLGYDIMAVGGESTVIRRYWFSGDDDGAIGLYVGLQASDVHVFRPRCYGCW